MQRNFNHNFSHFRLKYLVFGVAVIVALVLNVGGTQDLQFRIRLSQILHRSSHVQWGYPTEGGKEQIETIHNI